MIVRMPNTKQPQLKMNYFQVTKFTLGILIFPFLGLTVRPYASEHNQSEPIQTLLPKQAAFAENQVKGGTSSDTSALYQDVKLVLAQNYSGLDTASLISKIQAKLQWSEKDDRLIEAEGILHWDRGEIHLALPCLLRLAQPSPLAMNLIGQCLIKKGDRYEAATWLLMAARAYPSTSDKSIPLYKQFLEIKPNQGKVVMEFASKLELQKKVSEALVIYSRHQAEIILDTQATLHMGMLLSSQGRDKEAVTLYKLGSQSHPENKTLWTRQAEALELLNQKVDAAQAWIHLWDLDPLDTTARNRAMAHLEASGPGVDSALKSLVEKSLEKDPNSAALHFKLAVISLRAGDRGKAYLHLNQALSASPKNPTYLSRVPEAIDQDSLIKIYFPYLKSQSEREGASARVFQLVARGFSMTGEPAKACHAWIQAHTLSASALDGRRDALLDLAKCNDPISQSFAETLGDKLTPQGTDHEVLVAMSQVYLHNQSMVKATALNVRLVNAFPQEAPIGLAAAKILLSAGLDQEAKDVLTAVVEHVSNPEASFLLGKIYDLMKDCPHASEQFALAESVYPEASKLRGECLLEMKDYQGAAVEFETHHSRTGDKESLRSQARINRQMGNASQELKVLEELNSKNSASEEEKLRLGFLNAGQGDTSKALTLFTELLRTRASLPEDTLWSQAALMIGIRFAQEGKSEKAIKYLSMGLKSAPKSIPNRAELWMQIGDCYVERGQWKEAYFAFGQGLQVAPRSIVLARGQLQAAKNLNDKRNLEVAYRTINSLDSQDEGAHRFLSQSAQESGDYKEAAVHFRKISETHPTDPKAWENLGNALAMIPDLPAATSSLQTALDLGAESDEVYINRARAFRMEGSKDMAASILEFLLSRNHKDYLATLWSAKFAEEDGEQQKALAMFKQASKLPSPKTLWPQLATQGILEAKVVEAQ